MKELISFIKTNNEEIAIPLQQERQNDELKQILVKHTNRERERVREARKAKTTRDRKSIKDILYGPM